MATSALGMPDPDAVERPWIDAYPPGVPPAYPIPTVALPRLLADAVRDFPTAPAIDLAGRVWTWDEVAGLVRRTAGLLAGAGVGAGDRVAMVLPNVPAAAVVAFAVWQLGASLVPLDPTPADDPRHDRAGHDGAWLERAVGAARCRVVVGASDDLDRLSRLRDRLACVGTVVVTSVQRWQPRARRVALPPLRVPILGSRRRGPDVADLVDLDVVLAAAAPGTTVTNPRVEPTTEAVVLFDGAGGPGVVLSHANLVAGAFQARLWVPDVRAGRERVLCALPFSSGQGLSLGLLTATLVAATMVLPTGRPIRRSAAPSTPVDLAAEASALAVRVAGGRPTLAAMSLGMVRELVDASRAGGHDLTSLRICLATDGLLDADLVDDFEARTAGARLRQAHGSDRAGPLTHATPVYGRRLDGSIGLPVTGTTAIVVDPGDPARRLGPDATGELVVHGPQVMQGLLDDPAATAAVLHAGWLRTGELVRMGTDGAFSFVGRRDDAIEQHGLLVHPHRVAAVLCSHPDVMRASVVRGTGEGAPPTTPSSVVARVVPRPGTSPTPADLAVHCRHHLEAWEVPAVFDVVPESPPASPGAKRRRGLRRARAVTREES